MRLLALLLFAPLILTGCARTQPVPVQVQGLSMSLVTVESNADFNETLLRLRQAIGADAGLSVLAEFDHAQNARGAGLSLPPTRVLVFGNPAAGTPLMQAQRTVAIDLPQKMMVWEDGGRVLVSYNAPRYLAQRHGIEGQRERLDEIGNALARLAASAAGR